MVKFERLVLPTLQLCYAHAVHLAVTDVLHRCDIPDRGIETSEEEEDGDFKSAECVEYGYRSIRVRKDINRSVE